MSPPILDGTAAFYGEPTTKPRPYWLLLVLAYAGCAVWLLQEVVS